MIHTDMLSSAAQVPVVEMSFHEQGSSSQHSSS